jgi:hypothetical protein
MNSKSLLLKVNYYIKIEIELNDEKRENGSVSSESNISLTPSFQSQENGKTFKSFIVKNESPEFNENCIFYPPKSVSNILFYGNENNYVIIRYIYCIYERLNKVNIQFI